MSGTAIESSEGGLPPMRRAFHARLLFAITLGYGLSYTCRLSIDVVKKPLIDGGIYDPHALGTIGSALFFAYAFGKLINGFLADHANVRLFVAGGFLASAACNVGMALTTHAGLATVLWALNGWFQAFGAPGCIIAIATTFDDAHRGRAYGIWSSAHSIGEGLTFYSVGAMAAWLGWRAGFWGGAGYGVVAAALALLLLPRRFPRHAASAPHPAIVLRQQLAVLRFWPIWALGLSSAANYVTRYGINSWGVLYLQEARGFSLTQAGLLLLVSNLAGIAGSMALGFISDMLFEGRRAPANLLFGVVEVLGLVLIFHAPGSGFALWAGMILFGLGIGAINASIGGLFAVDFVPAHVVGAVVGMMGTFSYLGAGLQDLISGYLIEKRMTITSGFHHYDFGPAADFWIGSAAFSVLIGLLLWRTEIRRHQERRSAASNIAKTA